MKGYEQQPFNSKLTTLFFGGVGQSRGFSHPQTIQIVSNRESFENVINRKRKLFGYITWKEYFLIVYVS